jgi:hypothetical protein
MRLKDVTSVTQLGNWFRSKGLTPGENHAFGTVNPVHVGYLDRSWTSFHYHFGTSATLGVKQSVRGIQTPQGNLAIDLNDTGVSDDNFHRLIRGQWKLWKPKSETEALNYIYDRVLAVCLANHLPLAELFFAYRGYLATDPTHNHVIEGHMDHLHVAFSRHGF